MTPIEIQDLRESLSALVTALCRFSAASVDNPITAEALEITSQGGEMSFSHTSNHAEIILNELGAQFIAAMSRLPLIDYLDLGVDVIAPSSGQNAVHLKTTCGGQTIEIDKDPMGMLASRLIDIAKIPTEGDVKTYTVLRIIGDQNFAEELRATSARQAAELHQLMVDLKSDPAAFIKDIDRIFIACPETSWRNPALAQE